MNTIYITDIHVAIVTELLKELNKDRFNACITYDDLSCRLNRRVGPRQLAGFLGDISTWCKQIDAPMLSVLVINKHENKPGHGFFLLYSDLYGRKGKKEDEDLIFIQELKKVQQYNHWDDLKDLLLSF